MFFNIKKRKSDLSDVIGFLNTKAIDFYSSKI